MGPSSVLSSSSSILRVDGRTSEGTLRPLSCELSTLHKADGSALWKSGSTHVLAAVHGPLAPLNMNLEKNDSTIVSVIIKSGNSDSSTSTTESSSSSFTWNEWGTLLQSVLTHCVHGTKYPRTVIEIVLQVIRSDGSLLSSLLHAAVAALMDAGIELLYLPVATTCMIPSQPISTSTTTISTTTATSSSIWLDPSLAEEQEANNTILVIINPSQEPNKILGMHTIGLGVDLDTLLSCLQVSAKACPAIVAFWRLAVEQKVTRESQTLWSK